MAKMRISPELKKLIEKYRCVKDTEGMSPAKVYKLVGENENLYLKMTDSRYKGTTYDVEREKDMMLWLEGKLPVPKVLHTLQLLMYYIMGKHSGMDIFRNINKLGFFNPKLNTVYILEAERIPPEIIRTVEEDIICY